MGSGKNRQTFKRNEISHSLWKDSNVTFSRHLTKNQLGGVIFGCTRSTMKECLANQLFGLPAHHFSYVKNIEPGLPLFLFNYDEKKLYGIYEAASSGKMNIDPYAWTTDGSNKTKYPAQVQIRLKLQCQALAEHQFKPTIAENYYKQTHFWFELDHHQASKLLSKLSSLAVAPRVSTPQDPPKWTSVVQGFPSNNKREESVVSEPPPLTEFDEKDLMYMKLKGLAITGEFSDANTAGGVVGAAATSDVDWEHETYDYDQETNLVKWNGEGSSHPLDYPDIISQLSREMKELKTFKQEQTQKMEILEKKLAEAEQEIHRLENRCTTLESIYYNSMQPLDFTLRWSHLTSFPWI